MTAPALRSLIAIIGSGPAGLMAAEKLAEAGYKVTIYDRMPSVSRKFLMAGRGGLNLTHSEPLSAFLARYGKAAARLKSSIEAFPPSALREWCENYGQETFIGTSGRVFPKIKKASPLLRAWVNRLKKLGITFSLGYDWEGWDEKEQLIFHHAGSISHIKADAVVLALGGASWPKLGSNGAWTKILARDDIEIAPLRPANCGFVVHWSSLFTDKFAGSPLKPLSVSFNGETIQGEAIITRYGLEGGVLYALSSSLRDAIEAHGAAVLDLDLRPTLSVADIVKKLQAPRGSQSYSTYLRKALGLSPLAISLMREDVKNLPEDPQKLANLIKKTKVRLAGIAGIERAISSAGGISLQEIDDDFMLKKKSGIFAVGEMLDWEAPTGGYLLQACFSTAVAAAKGVERYLASQR